MAKQRLDKFLSNQLLISRNDVKIAVRRGKATVNGICVRDGAVPVCPENDIICFDNKQVNYMKFIYLLMNKPAGVLSASNDKSAKTVVDLVPQKWRRSTLFPVGRLDKDTTGLLIITDDGNFAHDCISPKKNVEKTYIAGLDGSVTSEMCDIFLKGVTLADGTVCRPAKLESIGENLAKITICEGKYHQIKRMFGTVGLGVNTLHRESVGCLILPESLKQGDCINLTENEVKSALKNPTYTF